MGYAKEMGLMFHGRVPIWALNHPEHPRIAVDEGQGVIILRVLQDEKFPKRFSCKSDITTTIFAQTATRGPSSVSKDSSVVHWMSSTAPFSPNTGKPMA
jgi:hypothetical protein